MPGNEIKTKTGQSLSDRYPVPLLQTLGVELVESGEHHAIMAVTVTDAHRNYYGGAHGGLIATLVDTSCFFPQPFIPSGKTHTTTNLNVQFVRPAAVGDRLTARAELLHQGRRTAALQVRITNQLGKLIAHGAATLMLLDRETSTERGEVSE